MHSGFWDPRAEPGSSLCWNSYSILVPSNQPDQIPLELFFPPVDQQSLSPTWCPLQTDWGCIQFPCPAGDIKLILRYWELASVLNPGEHHWWPAPGEYTTSICAIKSVLLKVFGIVGQFAGAWALESALMWKPAYITFKCRIKFCVNFGYQLLEMKFSVSEQRVVYIELLKIG